MTLDNSEGVVGVWFIGNSNGRPAEPTWLGVTSSGWERPARGDTRHSSRVEVSFSGAAFSTNACLPAPEGGASEGKTVLDLPRKYRPRDFDGVFGQAYIVRCLRGIEQRDR